MTFEKRRLADAEMGYAVSQLEIAGEVRAIAASEERGPAVVFEGRKPRATGSSPPNLVVPWDSPPFPGRDDVLFVITGFYPDLQSGSRGHPSLPRG
jgi:hypothetical protein